MSSPKKSVYGKYEDACARIHHLEKILRNIRSALTAGSSEEAATRNSYYWEPVIKTIDAALLTTPSDDCE